MESRTTKPDMSLGDLQATIEHWEKCGFVLNSLIGATYDGAQFNHVLFADAPSLPNNGPFTILVPLVNPQGDPAADPTVKGYVDGGRQMVSDALVYVQNSLARLVAVR
ncbi:MAG: hypothetical protein HYZ53_03980 [Planctomycetes bacterium]|nr:hypothetical protein [Planctomycetota bacterium]